MTYLIIGLFLALAIAAGTALMVAKNRGQKIAALTKSLDEAQRAQRLAEADAESLIKYLADQQAIEKVQAADVAAFGEAQGAEKHQIVSGVLDRLYGAR